MKALGVIFSIIVILSSCSNSNTTNSNIIPAPYSYRHPTWNKYRKTKNKDEDLNKGQSKNDEYYKGYYSEKKFN